MKMENDTDLLDRDGVNRRGFLKCMSWAGSAMIWTVAGGIPRQTEEL